MKDKNKILKVALYIRVSTDKQAKAGDSLREQEATLREYIRKNENMVEHDTYIDDGISGQKLNRDEFTRLIDDIKEGEIDIIIFTKLDRWFRSLRHYLNTQAILEQHGVTWTAVSQPFFDTTNAHGRAFVAQSMTWAELEAQNDSERILAVFENKVKNGEVISGNAPLGYKIVNKHLVPNEDADKIKSIFEYYNKHANVRATMRYAGKELGIIRSHNQIKRILQNTKYKGIFRDNKNFCEPIISVELWENVNMELSRNVRSNKKYNYVFSGLIVCADCNKKMSACTVKKRKNYKILKTPDEVKYRYPSYRCQGYSADGKCINTKQFYETTLEKRLLKMLKPALREHLAAYELANAPMVNNNNKIKALERKLERLKELFINELITLDEYKIDKAGLEEQINKIPTNTQKPKDLTGIKNILDRLDNETEDVYFALDHTEKQFFWRSIAREIRIDNDKNIDIIFL